MVQVNGSRATAKARAQMETCRHLAMVFYSFSRFRHGFPWCHKALPNINSEQLDWSGFSFILMLFGNETTDANRDTTRKLSSYKSSFVFQATKMGNRSHYDWEQCNVSDPNKSRIVFISRNNFTFELINCAR